MKRYTFVCQNGHERGVFLQADITADLIAEMSSCDCGGVSKLTRLPDAKVVHVINGFQAHYNVSLDRFINTKRELLDIQKQYADAGHPIQTYERSLPRSTDWKEMGREAAEIERAIVEADAEWHGGKKFKERPQDGDDRSSDEVDIGEPMKVQVEEARAFGS